MDSNWIVSFRKWKYDLDTENNDMDDGLPFDGAYTHNYHTSQSKKHEMSDEYPNDTYE